MLAPSSATLKGFVPTGNCCGPVGPCPRAPCGNDIPAAKKMAASKQLLAKTFCFITPPSPRRFLLENFPASSKDILGVRWPAHYGDLFRAGDMRHCPAKPVSYAWHSVTRRSADSKGIVTQLGNTESRSYPCWGGFGFQADQGWKTCG